DMVYLLGADEFDTEALRDTFVVYQGHHGDAGASVADVILPGSAYTEKNGLYVNTEGRVQTTRLATFAPGDAREDWTILRALSGALGQPLGFDDLEGLRQSLIQAVPHMGGIDQIAPVEWALPGAAGDLSDAPFEAAVGNYYMTCPISRTSQTMAECTEVYLAGSLDQAREAAE
ncbi:MAG: molybdopterin-dependent oxidoreductase, partial [Pseudomonadota bacterium]|nr:molybdopterin-dependent oxidoreductase [Pseudomonadota bacterium]